MSLRNLNLTFLGQKIAHSGSVEAGTRTVTSTPDTLIDGDYDVATNLTVAGAVALTLPANCGVGMVLRVRDDKGDAAANNITINAPAGETIDGAATATITVNYGCLVVMKDGALTWTVLSRSFASAGAMGAHAASHRAGGADPLLAAPGVIGGTTPAAGTFTALTVNTSMSLAAAATIASVAGAGSVDLSLWTGVFKTPTGTATLGGDTNLTAGKKFNLGQATVSQATNINTSVTCNAASGVITTQSATTAAATIETGFTLNNSCISATSVVTFQIVGYSGTHITHGIPYLVIESPGAGTINVKVGNIHEANALNGTLKIHFMVA